MPFRHHHFRNFAFFGAPFVAGYAAYADWCWQQVGTPYGSQWTNVCYDYGNYGYWIPGSHAWSIPVRRIRKRDPAHCNGQGHLAYLAIRITPGVRTPIHSKAFRLNALRKTWASNGTVQVEAAIFVPGRRKTLAMKEFSEDDRLYLDDLHIGQSFTSGTHVVGEAFEPVSRASLCVARNRLKLRFLRRLRPNQIRPNEIVFG